MRKTVYKPAVFAMLAMFGAMCLPNYAFAAKKVLRLRFDGAVHEAPNGGFDPKAIFGGGEPKTLHEWLRTIEKAGDDDGIAGIAMIIEEPEVGISQVDEISKALKQFRSKGKKVYCYLDSANNISYALACGADHITLADNSALDIHGLHAEPMYMKGLFDKIGVDADMLHCGAYKSALEPYTRTGPSKEAAENIDWLLDGIYNRWIELMAAGRNLDAAKMKEAVDKAPILSKDALEMKLVDAVGSFEDFRKLIQKDFGKDVEIKKSLKEREGLDLDMNNPFAMIGLFQKMMSSDEDSGKAAIGLVYVDGPIVTGRTEPSLFGGSSTAASTTIRAALDKAREDENVKAVVLRVDSPGGSALASDIIWEAATRLGKEKPLIVSMGSVAGSGGYYVAIPGDTIFADETTITGSIGVVGGKLVWKGLMEDKLGITHAEFNRGARAGLMSMNHKWTDNERQLMQSFMDSIYRSFKGRVKQSRGERIKGDLDSLAGGRVYTGKQAKEKGLIDEIGGLSDAMKLAAKRANLGSNYEIKQFPPPMDLKQLFKMLSGKDDDDDMQITAAPKRDAGDAVIGAVLPLLKDIAPAQARQIVDCLQNAVILNQEHVGCFMPFDLNAK